MSGAASGGEGHTPRLGSTLGRYRIESVLGRGGMGVVLLATDQDLGRPVALKLLAPELASDPAFRERFLRESRLAAAIEHPAIVPVYEAGELDRLLFIAMRYVPGPDLATVLRREAPLTVVRTLALGAQLAEALDAAHARGLVHRDVKPANVLLEPGDPERAYLADFGLTRRRDDTVGPSVAGLAGTLDYMAPEGIEGRSLDGRADQYSLGCLLFHCLAGSVPFAADSDAALLYAHVQAPRPRLSERRPELGTALDPVLARALARDPSERYPDCRELLVDAWRATPGAAGESPARPVRGQVPGAAGATGRGLVDSAARATSTFPRGGSRPLIAVIAGVATVLVLGLAASEAIHPGGPAASARATGETSTEGFAAGATEAPQSAGDSVLAGSPSPDAGPPAPLDGWIVFASDREGDFDLWAIDPDGSDLRRLTKLDGDERAPDVTPDGTRIAFWAQAGGRNPNLYLMWPDRSHWEQITFDPAPDYGPAFSPDGTRLAFISDRAGHPDIWLMTDTGHGFVERDAENLTKDAGSEHNLTWAPDGASIAYSSDLAGDPDLWVLAPERPARPQRLTAGSLSDLSPTWSTDGTSIVFVRTDPGQGDADLYTVDADRAAVRPFIEGTFNDLGPDFSPYGSAIVFARGRVSERGEPFDQDLMVATRTGERTRRLTRNMNVAIDPSWARSPSRP